MYALRDIALRNAGDNRAGWRTGRKVFFFEKKKQKTFICCVQPPG
jgi:hypothetical protein